MDPKRASIDNPAKILKGIGVVVASYISEMYNTEKK